MDRIIIATIKSWNIKKANSFKQKNDAWEVIVISNKDMLAETVLSQLSPKYIFFPHWSWIIPKEIYMNYECIVFHMTDLPFGRGGSPLQNLLVRGIYQTKISAIRVDGELDGGDVYIKRDLDISKGNADEILNRASDIIFNEMIPEIIEKRLIPVEQEGEVTEFRRRTSDQSLIPKGLTQRQIYDYIRMLDGEGYPPAFSMIGNRKVTYRNAYMENGLTHAEAEFE